jgi:hypothetical protein
MSIYIQKKNRHSTFRNREVDYFLSWLRRADIAVLADTCPACRTPVVVNMSSDSVSASAMDKPVRTILTVNELG